jgi:Flp pilus assembly protein CpaB
MKMELSGSARRLLLASAVGILTTTVVIALFEIDEKNSDEPLKTVPVFVAKSYIASQSVLNAACCYEKRIPEIYAPPKPLSKKDLSAARWRARGEILKGEILTSSRVGDVSASASAAWELGDDEAAITVHMTPEAAMAGVLSAGDTVNVLATFEKRSCALVADVRVLAVGKRAARNDENASPSDETLVTLKLESRDAMRTVLASQKAALSLALVSPLGTHAMPACVAFGDL